MCDCLFLVEKAHIMEISSIQRADLSLRGHAALAVITQSCGGSVTVRYILNWQLRTPSVSSSQADAFYINMAEKWIGPIMIWSWGMTSAMDLSSCFIALLLPARWLLLNFRDDICMGADVAAILIIKMMISVSISIPIDSFVLYFYDTIISCIKSSVFLFVYSL